MTASTPPTSSSHPLGSSSGWALDVIIVAPSPKQGNNKGVAASSDFYASFPSSLAKPKNKLSAPAAKRLSLFASKKSFSNVSSNSSTSEGGEGELISPTSSSSSQQTTNTTEPKGNVQVRINGRYISKLDMIFSNNSSSCRFVHGNGLRPSVETLNMIIDGTYDDTGDNKCSCSEAVKNSEHHLCAKNNTSSGEVQSKGPVLNSGRNLIRYTLVSENGTAIAYTEANVYLWSALDSVIVSDIDGTVTKDNVGGVMDTVVQEKFVHIHSGICKFFQDLTKISPVEDMSALNSSYDGEGQIRFMYLSSRPISLVNNTRKLLVSVSQTCEAKELHNLPSGPMFCNVVPLSSVLYSELVAKTVHKFKADVLSRQVVLPFVAARGEDWRKTKTAKSARTLGATELEEIDENTNLRSLSDVINEPFVKRSSSIIKDDRLFLAGFGNTIRDAMAYEMAGIDRDDIYIIDPKSRIMCMGEQSQSQNLEDVNQSECIPDTEWISDVAVGVCCLGSGDSQVEPDDGDAPTRREACNLSNESKFISPAADSTRAIFNEPQSDNRRLDPFPNKSNNKTVKISGTVTQSIRAFTNKKSFAKFPSFSSSVSSRSSKSSSKKSPSNKVIYQSYDDPRLLEAVRKRIQGDYDPFPVEVPSESY